MKPPKPDNVLAFPGAQRPDDDPPPATAATLMLPRDAALSIGEQEFADELALALDDIERLTADECCGIAFLLQGADEECEPIFAFLALHPKLSYILGSPHAGRFRAQLREWGANAAIMTALRSSVVGFRYRYRPGATPSTSTLKHVMLSDGMACYPTIGTSQEIRAERERRAASETKIAQLRAQEAEKSQGTVRQLKPGDVFRFRWWDGGNWKRRAVVNVTDDEVTVAMPTSRKQYTMTRAFLCDPDIRVEIISRADGQQRAA